ncbi:hypothetical protein M440DRAFT_1394895 [Trichoderma longibrachiatum ATCC 18648]|uniref:Uncharacterized protein n=1 Tax=Trichoderma longibrachiatum ATCC 18648 TaxID=983965 RepID=A0A2T4BSC8_TRILO|nr:hypothetical protein M440DRAFT_1394895 [Trichoderma longibrachiatum ATCC 18648]
MTVDLYKLTHLFDGFKSDSKFLQRRAHKDGRPGHQETGVADSSLCERFDGQYKTFESIENGRIDCESPRPAVRSVFASHPAMRTKSCGMPVEILYCFSWVFMKGRTYCRVLAEAAGSASLAGSLAMPVSWTSRYPQHRAISISVATTFGFAGTELVATTLRLSLSRAVKRPVAVLHMWCMQDPINVNIYLTLRQPA